MSERKIKADVREVLEAYSGAAARLDIEEYMTFFTDDAVMHGIVEMFGQTGPLVGKDAIRGFFGPALGGLKWLQQLNSITDIHIADDGKSATTSLALQERAGDDDREILMFGRYDDKLVLTDNGWKFAERRLNVYRFKPVTDAGGT